MNRGHDSNDVAEMKALAATARSAASPAPRARAAELSGVVGRRESVVGMRVTGAPRAAGGTSWSWVAIGCLAVVAPGMGGLWYLNHASSAPAITSHVPSAAAPAPSAATAQAFDITPIEHQPSAPAEPEPEPAATRSGSKAERPSHHHASKSERAAQAGVAAADDAPIAAGGDQDQATPKVARAEKPEKAEKTEAAEPQPQAESADQAEKPKADKPAEEAEEEAPPTGSTKLVKRLQATLTRLEARVDQCHSRFQVDGTAKVKVMVSPSGTVESLMLKGDFEGTPTGDCIVRQLSAASFPSFDGSDAVRVSHSFSLE